MTGFGTHQFQSKRCEGENGIKKTVAICIVLLVVVIAGVAVVTLPTLAKARQATQSLTLEQNLRLPKETEKTPDAQTPAVKKETRSVTAKPPGKASHLHVSVRVAGIVLKWL